MNLARSILSYNQYQTNDMKIEMFIGVAVVIVLFSLDSFAKDVPPVNFSGNLNGMSLVESFLENLPSNDTNYFKSSQCLSDLNQIRVQLQNRNMNALRSKFASFKIISINCNTNRNVCHSDRCVGKIAVRNFDWKSLRVWQFWRMLWCADQKTNNRWFYPSPILSVKSVCSVRQANNN